MSKFHTHIDTDESCSDSYQGEVDSGEKVESDNDEPSRNALLAECAVNADRLLQSIGLSPCASVWTTEAYKSERQRITCQLVSMRDQSDEMKNITGNILFFLNAPFFYSLSKRKKDSSASDWQAAIETTFNSFFMRCMELWPKYNPLKGATYTSYMSYLGFKVQFESRDLPAEEDANKLYMYRKLSSLEQAIIDANAADPESTGLSYNDIKARLHYKSGYSNTVIDMYFQWKLRRMPVSIDDDESPAAAMPIPVHEKSGKEHLRGPEEAALENDTIARFMARVDEMIGDGTFQGQGDPATIREMLYQLTLSGMPGRKGAKEYGLSDSWQSIKHRLLRDATVCEILGIQKAKKSKVERFKIPTTERADAIFPGDAEDEEVSSFDITSFSKKHELE